MNSIIGKPVELAESKLKVFVHTIENITGRDFALTTTIEEPIEPKLLRIFKKDGNYLAVEYKGPDEEFIWQEIGKSYSTEYPRDLRGHF